MKLKFKLMTVFAALGVASSGFAAWNFATATSGEANIAVGIEAASGSIGTIDFDEIGMYNLADTPNPLVFNGKFTPGSGVNVAEVNLTYKVTLNAALADLISFGSASEGVWVSDVPTSITPVWNAGKNPSDLAAYNAIKANLANLSMNVTLSATKKDGSDPVPPSGIAPGALPAGLVAGPDGIIEFDKDLGPVQLSVEGIDEHGSSSGISQVFNWTSSDPTRASVVDGLVTPLADGDVTITATAATLAGKGLKKAEGAAKYDFKLHITGFTVIPPDPVATLLRLVLPEGIEDGHEMEIGDELNISAVVLDENGDVMAVLVPEATLMNEDSATYINGVLKAVEADAEGLLAFSYGDLEDVEFNFVIKAAAPVINVDHIVILGANPLVLDFEEMKIGQLAAEVYDNDNKLMAAEEVVWSAPNEDVIMLDDDGTYMIAAPGTVTVTATSVTDSSVKANLVVTVSEPPVVEHVVKFNVDGVITSENIIEGEVVAKPADPVKEGYSFVGWQVDGVAYVFTTPVTAPITIVAVFSQNTYTVTFNSNGGSSVPAQQVKHGELAVEPIPDPTLEDYSFYGWFNGENPYDFNTPVISTLELTAHWNLIVKHTVTFNTNGGSEVAAQQVEDGQVATIPANPTKAGHTFVKWLLGEVEYNFETPVTGPITLVAEWVEDGPVVPSGPVAVFDFSSMSDVTRTSAITEGTISEMDDYYTSDFPVSYSNYARVYYGFGSGGSGAWQTLAQSLGSLKIGALKGELAGTITLSFEDILVTNIRFEGIPWANDNPDANFLLNNQELGSMFTKVLPTDDQLQTFDFALDNPSDTLEFANYGGARYLISKMEIYSTPIPPAANLKSVAITNAPGALVEEKETLQLNTLVKDVEDVTVENVSLAWESLNPAVATVNNKGLVTAVAPGTAMIRVVATRGESVVETQYAVTVTARDPDVKHTVTFDSDGGSEVAPVEVNDGAKVAKPADPTKDGVSFVEWQLNGVAYDFEAPVTGPITLKAVWEVAGEVGDVKVLTITQANGLPGDYTENGLSYTAVSTKIPVSNSPDLQLDSSKGAIFNTTAVGELVSVTFIYAEGGAGGGAVKIYGATTAFANYGDGTALLTAPTLTNQGTGADKAFTYEFAAGLTYFKLAANSKNTRVSSIVITYK